MVWKIHKGGVCFSYKQIQGDHTLFFKYSQGGKIIVLDDYVYDTIVTGYDLTERQLLKEKLSAEFEMKEFSQLKCLLGIDFSKIYHIYLLESYYFYLNIIQNSFPLI